jgi:hypothetical protein
MGNADILICRPVVFFGTAGSPAATKPCLLRDADTVKRSRKLIGANKIRLAERSLPSASYHTGEEITYEFNLHEVTVALVAKAMALAAVGNVVSMGDPSVSMFHPQFSFAIAGSKADGSSYYERVPYACAAGEAEMSFGVGEQSVIPITIEALDPDENTGGLYPTIIDGSTDVDKTLSSGSFARTQDFHRVIGEGSAADALTDITGASLLNGETVTLQIYAAAQPITITHGAGTLELQGAANWVMTSINDMLVLQYDLPNTKWVEVERFMARR